MISVRPAIVSDADAIAKVYVDAWRHAYANILPAAVLSNMSYLRETAQFARQLNRPIRSTRLFVATGKNGKITGFANFGTERALSKQHLAEIYTLYVAPTHMRQGVGRRLMAETSEQLQADGQCGVVLWVLKKNTNARAFYSNLGGRLFGESTSPVGRSRFPVVCYKWHNLPALEAAAQPKIHVDLPI